MFKDLSDIALDVREDFDSLDDGDGVLTFSESGLSGADFDALSGTHDVISLAELLEATVGGVGPRSTVWVDFDYRGDETGGQFTPFNTLNEAAVYVAAEGRLRIKRSTSGTFPGFDSSVMIPGKAVVVTTLEPSVTIGSM